MHENVILVLAGEFNVVSLFARVNLRDCSFSLARVGFANITSLLFPGVFVRTWSARSRLVFSNFDPLESS